MRSIDGISITQSTGTITPAIGYYSIQTLRRQFVVLT